MIQVSSKVEVIEINGKDVGINESEVIEVKNHWSANTLVVLVVDGKSFTVSVKEMEAAIKNATNTAKY